MDTFRHIRSFARGRTIHIITLGVALGVAGVGASAAARAGVHEPGVTTEASANHICITRSSERSILPGEDEEPTPVAEFVPLTTNLRSILLIESREAPGGVLAGGIEDAPTANERSIALIESKEPNPGTACAEAAAGEEAQGWPNFDSTNIAERDQD